MSVRVSIRAAPTPVPSGLLAPSDLTYLGSFKMPVTAGATGYPYGYPYLLAYSWGALAARRSGGNLTFLIPGPAYGVGLPGPMVTEITYPGESLTSPPRADVVRFWDDTNQGHILGAGVALRVNGLWIDPATGYLWQGYKDLYSDANDPSLVVVQLNNDGTTTTSSTCTVNGPWRCGCGAGRANGWMMPTPAAYQGYVGGATATIGAFTGSRNAICSIGCNFHAWTPVSPSTPPDSATDTSEVSIPTINFMDFNLDHRQIRHTNNYLLCGWPTQPYNSNDAGVYTNPPDLTFSGGQTGSIVDTANTGIWIDTGTKRGALFLGAMADTIAGHNYDGKYFSQSICHNWYGTNCIPYNQAQDRCVVPPPSPPIDPTLYDPGNSCPHGEVAIAQGSTSPAAGTLTNQAWMFDPQDFIPVAQGSVPSYTPQSVYEFRLAAVPSSTIPEEAPQFNAYNGSYYDDVTGKLFVCEKEYDLEGCCAPVPRIHVFQVAS